MDITLVSHLGSVAPTSDAYRAPVAKGPQPSARPAVEDAGRVLVERAIAVAAVEIAEAVQAVDQAELPLTMKVRSQLNVDDGSRRVFSRTVDRETGTAVRQYPTEEQLRLFAKTREQLNHILKADV